MPSQKHIAGLNQHENNSVMHVTTAILQGTPDVARPERIYQPRAMRKSALAAEIRQDGRAVFALQARDAPRPYLAGRGRSRGRRCLRTTAGRAGFLPKLGAARGLETYLTDHPTHQNATASVTAVIAASGAALKNAITDANNSKRPSAPSATNVTPPRTRWWKTARPERTGGVAPDRAG
jgi:hypothetical protein